MSETGIEKEADVASALPIGSAVEVIVQEVDAENGRIRVSRKAIFDAQEQSELREYAQRKDSAPQSLGSLAEKLRGALGARQK
jgi:ribosomal protein S1